MATDNHLDLISRVLDGEGSARDIAALDVLRAEEADVRELYDKLEATTIFLAAIPQVQPSPHLAGRILSALPAGRYARRVPERQMALIDMLRDAFAGMFTRRPAFALAYAVVLGVALGVTGYSVVSSSSQPLPSDVYGTIASPGTASEVLPADAVEISHGGIQGLAHLSGRGEVVMLELDFDAVSPTDVTVTFDPEVLQWSNLRRHAGDAIVTIAERGVFQLRLSGDAHYQLHFDASPGLHAITLAVGENGTEVGTYALSTSTP